MKKITLLIALLSALTFYGQHKIAGRIQQLTLAKTSFTKVAPFTVSNRSDAASTVAANATFATLNTRILQTVTVNKPGFIELAVPYNGANISVLLYRVEVLAKDFHVDTDKGYNLPLVKGVFYRGIVKGDSNSIASFSFFEDEVSGVISASGINNLVVGKLKRTGNVSDYIIYSDADLNIPFTFNCGVTDTAALSDLQGRGTEDILSDRCVTVYFELDYDAFVENGEDVGATVNWITAIFNNVQALYENDGITTALKSVYVWTEPDNYFGETSFDYLQQFYFARPTFDGDVGQLITTNGGGLGGVAADIGGICSDNNVSFSDVFYDYQDVPLFSWTIEVITHELGHLYGSPHTHGCYWNGNNTAIDGCGTTAGFIEGNCEIGPLPENQGTIMSYCHLVDGVGINFANGFGEQPASRILNHVNASRCLSSDCISTCINTVSNFAVSSTRNSATITWQDESAGPWEVGYATVNGGIVNYTEVSVNSITFSSLNTNTYYKFSIRPACGAAMEAEDVEFIFATSADWCSPQALFTDTGGESRDYRDNQHIIRTIKPDAPNQSYVVEFYTFDLEQDYDYLYVYDGPDTNAPSLGIYTGSDYPGPFESTATDGSLTFEFWSDAGVTEAGWSAHVLCSLGIKESTFTNLNYYPNPTNGVVTITAAEGITGITVYNAAGQVLLNQAVNNTTVETNIAAFANGIYFFKVTNGNETANFRVIKQ